MAERQRDTSTASSGTSSAAQPFDEAAEQAVLGAILLDPKTAVRDVVGRLTPEDFFRESHRAIYRAILALDEAKRGIDLVVLLDKLREQDTFQTAGGGAYVSRLASVTPTAANVEHYVSIVREKALLRRILAFARETITTVAQPTDSADALADDIAQRALALATGSSSSSVARFKEILASTHLQLENRAEAFRSGRIAGVPSGFRALDGMTSGWQQSDLIVLAARPGMGKTAFALNMLVNAARQRTHRVPGVIFSLEMSKEQLAGRIWASCSQVSLKKFRDGDVKGVWTKLLETAADIEKLPIFIDDTPQITVTEMMRKCRQLKHEHGIGLIVVDYLQLMGSNNTSRNTNREQQISEISRSLKGLAKELHVPVIALSQLNRGVESRTDKRPMLSDLRESGAIEQDADLIVFLYSDAYYERMKGGSQDEDAPPTSARSMGAPQNDSNAEPSITEVIIAKHRSGETGKIKLLFDGKYTLFSNLAPEGPPVPDDRFAPPPHFQSAPPPPDDDAFDFAPPPPDPTRGISDIDDDFIPAPMADDGDDSPF